MLSSVYCFEEREEFQGILQRVQDSHEKCIATDKCELWRAISSVLGGVMSVHVHLSIVDIVVVCFSSYGIDIAVSLHDR